MDRLIKRLSYLLVVGLVSVLAVTGGGHPAFEAQALGAEGNEPMLELGISFVDTNGDYVGLQIYKQNWEWDWMGIYRADYWCFTSGWDAMMPRVQFMGLSIRISGVFDTDASALVQCFGSSIPTQITYDLTLTPDGLTHSHGGVVTNSVGADGREAEVERWSLDVWEAHDLSDIVGTFDGVDVDWSNWIWLRYGHWQAQQ